MNTLQTSKTTSQEVIEQLGTAEQTEAKIDAAREVRIWVYNFIRHYGISWEFRNELVNTLQTSKTTSQEVIEQLGTAEQTEAKIDAAREVRILVYNFIRNYGF